MDSKDIFDGVIKGVCFGFASIYATVGLLCNAGFMPSLGLAYGTNYLVTAIVFYGIPGVIDRVDNFFAKKVTKQEVVPAADIAKIFEKETSYRGIGGGNHVSQTKKKRMVAKKVTNRKK